MRAVYMSISELLEYPAVIGLADLAIGYARDEQGRQAVGSNLQNLLNDFIRIRDDEYHTDPERDEARLNNIECALQTLIEILIDEAERRAG